MQKIAISRRLILGLSGAAKIIQAHINHFSSKGIAIDVYHQKSKHMIYGKDVKTHKITNIFKKNNDYTFAVNLKKKISPKKYDLKIGHGDDWSSDLVFIHNLYTKLHEELFHEPKTDLNPNDLVQKELLEQHRFKHIIANSQLVKKELCDRYNFKDEEITVIYPGYDEKIFSVANKSLVKQSAHTAYQVPLDTFKIGFYTSGGFNKRGIEIFIDTIKQLPQYLLANCFVIIVGKTEDKSKISSALKTIGLHPNQFKIFEPIADVLSLLSLADIIVHPAYFEEFGMIVQEALALGIPVLSSKKVGAIEIFSHDQLQTPEAPKAEIFASQLVQIYNDTVLYDKLSNIAANCTVNNTFKHHLNNLDGVIKNNFL